MDVVLVLFVCLVSLVVVAMLWRHEKPYMIAPGKTYTSHVAACLRSAIALALCVLGMVIVGLASQVLVDTGPASSPVIGVASLVMAVAMLISWGVSLWWSVGLTVTGLIWLARGSWPKEHEK